MRVEGVAVRTERSQVRTKTTEVQYSTVRLEQARLVSSLLSDTRTKLVNFVFADFRSVWSFPRDGPYGQIPTRTNDRSPNLLNSLNSWIYLRTTSPYDKAFKYSCPRHRNHRMFLDPPYIAISQSSMPNDQLKMIKKKDAFSQRYMLFSEKKIAEFLKIRI